MPTGDLYPEREFYRRDPFHSLFTFLDSEIENYSHRFEGEETENGLDLTLDLPGYQRSEIDIQIEKNVLTVRAEGKRGKIEQAITLSDDFDLDKLEAKLEHGLLTIKVPKSAASKPRKVQVT